uniref:Uncharacterized protein n=1 Tax=Salarias fasciatus TaxID=181472 RepID=A0A672IDW0_SALFA
MQERSVFTHKAAAAALCILVLMLIQQASAAPAAPRVQPLSHRGGADTRGEHAVHTLRRIARMTPLWRIMNSKPFGAYCQNNYECSTGFCSAGQCSNSQAPVKS